MKYRQKPNGMWVVDYLDDQGDRKRISTGIKTAPSKTPPADVKAAGREIILGIRVPVPNMSTNSGQARKQDGRMTMSDLFDRCEATVWHPDNVRSHATIRSNLKILRPLIGHEAIEDITFQRLQDLVQGWKAHGYAPGTIKRKLDMISKSLRMATMWTDERGLPLLPYKPPMPKFRIDNLKDRIITRPEEDAIFTAIEKRRQLEPDRPWFRFAALIRVLFDTAARLGETLEVGPSNVANFGQQAYLTFPRYRTKSGKPRSIPLLPSALAALRSLDSHLILDRKTQEWRYFGLRPARAWYLFDTIREDVKAETGMDLSDVTLHTIRHTTATRLAQGGMELGKLQEWLGHSDPKITAERYVHLMPSDLVGGLSILGTNPSSGTTPEQDRVKPVIVPSTFGAANGASTGTPRPH
jgi:integrase